MPKLLPFAFAALLAWAELARAAGWPTAGHDTRRTGQAEVNGPATAVPPFSTVVGGSLINMP